MEVEKRKGKKRRGSSPLARQRRWSVILKAVP